MREIVQKNINERENEKNLEKLSKKLHKWERNGNKNVLR